MPFQFSCPHCGSATIVDDQYSGQSGPCVACGKQITLPNFAPQRQSAAKPFLASLGKPARWLIAIVTLVLLTSFSISALRYGGATAKQVQTNVARNRSISNLNRIAAALNAYADKFKQYPAAYTTDVTGRRMMSWRVAILPFLGYQGLYNDYRKDLPWDHPENLNLMGNIPTEYQTPGDDNAALGYTSYVVITGPGTLFPPQREPFSAAEITDGLDETLLVVESQQPINRPLNWMEPNDLAIETMSFGIGGVPGKEIGGMTEGGAAAATCDGRPHFLRSNLSYAYIKGLITPNGNEAIPDDALD